MKILRNFILLLMVAAMLVGCRATGRGTPDYRTEPFRAEIRWDCEGVTVYAEIETMLADGVLSLYSLRLLSPPTLAGIELICENGKLVLAREGIRMTAVGAAGWWKSASLLCNAGELRYVCDTEWEGLALEYAEITDGTRVTEVLREPNTGIPKRLAEGENALTVIRFEPITVRG